MSTRAQIIVKDSSEEIWFYRHSDGYPDGVMPMLEKFLDYVKRGILRDNAMQSCGWLVLFGAREYDLVHTYDAKTKKFTYKKKMDITLPPEKDMTGMSWKCGSIEPCGPVVHGDTEYLYTVDVEKKTILVQGV